MARRGERPPIGLSWIVTWPLSAAFAALVFLAAEEIHHPTHEVAPTPPPAVGGRDWNARLPGRIAAVDAALHRAPLQLPQAVEDERGSGPLRWTHRLYEIELPQAEQAQAEAAIETVRGVDPGLAITAENTTDGSEVRVGLDGLLVSTLRFRWAEAAAAKKTRPRVAVVIGPLGDDLRVARQVVGIEAPVVLGVRPFRPFSREVAELGHMFDREVVVQLDGSEAQPEASDEPAEATGPPAVDDILASVPQAVGVAWQAGTNQPDPHLREEIERRQLLFVGERAPHAALPPPAVIVDAAAEGVAAQLGTLVERARSEGSVIIVGPPTEATLDTLTHVLPEWRAADVEIVPLSALTQPVNLSAR
jgi:polysaccharide deacetylase 2 family uncharacterized protein YibQ